MTYRRAKALDKNIVWAEYFNSEQEVRKRGYTISAATAFNGDGTCTPGDGGYIHVNESLGAGSYSVRVRLKSFIAGVYNYWLTWYQQGVSGTTGVLRQYNGATEVEIGSGVSSSNIYVNGVDTNTIPATADEIEVVFVFSKSTPLCSSFRIGNYQASTANDLRANIVSIEIFNKILTQEEVTNLYNDARYHIPSFNREGAYGTTELVDTQVSSNGTGNWIGNITNVHTNGVNFITGSGTSYLYNICDVSPSTDYIFRFKAKRGNADPVDYAVYDHTNSAWISQSTNYSSLINTSDYTDIEIRFTTPGTCAKVRIYVVRNLPAETIYIKDISLRQEYYPALREWMNITAFNGVVHNRLTGQKYGKQTDISLDFASDWGGIGGGGMATSGDGYFTTTIGSSGARITAALFTIDQSYIVHIKGNSTSAGEVNNDTSQAQAFSSGSFEFDWIITAADVQMRIVLNLAGSITIEELYFHTYIPEVVNTAIEVVKDQNVRAPRLNGTSSKITVGDYFDPLDYDVTIVGWYNVQDNGQTYQRILSKRGTGWVEIYLRNATKNLNAAFAYDYGAESQASRESSSGAYEFGKWAHFAVTWDWTERRVRLFIDGEPDLTNSFSVPSQPIAEPGEVWELGIFGSSSELNGMLSDIRVIQGKLSYAEISQHFTSTKHLYGR